MPPITHQERLRRVIADIEALIDNAEDRQELMHFGMAIRLLQRMTDKQLTMAERRARINDGREPDHMARVNARRAVLER